MAIRGITVTLYERHKVDNDPFDAPIYECIPIDVENVLISPASGTEVVEKESLYGKKAVYNLGIPKGDVHEFKRNGIVMSDELMQFIGKEVEFFGKRWKVFGPVLEGIEENIPLRWNKKVTVERYE